MNIVEYDGTLARGRDAGGLRWRIACGNGRTWELHAGEAIDVWTDDGWIAGRWEPQHNRPRACIRAGALDLALYMIDGMRVRRRLVDPDVDPPAPLPVVVRVELRADVFHALSDVVRVYHLPGRPVPVPELLAELGNNAAAGLARPGSWERGWLTTVGLEPGASWERDPSASWRLVRA